MDNVIGYIEAFKPDAFSKTNLTHVCLFFFEWYIIYLKRCPTQLIYDNRIVL